MEKIDTQITNTDQTKGIKQKKKMITIIGIVVAAVIVIFAVLLYIFLYKIPYNEAVANLDSAVEKYNTEVANFDIAIGKYNVEVSALARRNKELDDNITALNQVINAKNIPIDELLLSEAQSILTEALNFPKDSAPVAPDLSKNTEEVIAVSSDVSILTKEVIAATSKVSILTEEAIAASADVSILTEEVCAMGNYSDMLAKVQATESKYRSMIEDFKGGESEVVWFGVDKENTVLRFVIKLSNSNDYTLRGVTTEWIAYDIDDAVVGSFDGSQPDIPANGYVYYVGGAGSANLSGTPVRVEVKIATEGLLTNRVSPQITVSNVQVKNNGYGFYSVSAGCATDSDIKTVDIDGQIIVKDADGQIIDADFWNADNLPDNLGADDKFKVSADFFDLPAIPKSAEVYMYYKWE